MGSSLPIVSDTRPGRTQIFWMYALEGDRVSVDAPIVLKDSKSLVRHTVEAIRLCLDKTKDMRHGACGTKPAPEAAE